MKWGGEEGERCKLAHFFFFWLCARSFFLDFIMVCHFVSIDLKEIEWDIMWHGVAINNTAGIKHLIRTGCLFSVL